MVDQDGRLPPVDEDTFVFRIYIAGNTPNSLQAIANLQAICREYFPKHHIDIVDVFEETQYAIQDNILVTPTVIKLSPPTVRRMIGNLNSKEAVLMALGIAHSKAK